MGFISKKFDELMLRRDWRQLFSAVGYELLDDYCEKYGLTYYPEIKDQTTYIMVTRENDPYCRHVVAGEIPWDAIEHIKLRFDMFIEAVEAATDAFIRELEIIDNNEFVATKTQINNPGIWHVMDGSYNRCMEAINNVVKEDRVNYSKAIVTGTFEEDGFIQLEYNGFTYKVSIKEKQS